MCIIDSLMCRFVCHRIVGSLYYVIKRPLQYNELAKRTPAYGDILAFVDISKYTLKFVSLSVRFQFVEVRWRTLLFSQYVEGLRYILSVRRDYGTSMFWQFCMHIYTRQ